MSNELRAEAERLTTGEGYPDGFSRQVLAMTDAIILADAYLADIAKREREAAERTLPVTEEWFNSLNRRRGHTVAVWAFAEGLSVDNGHECVVINRNPTRGHVLDLLSALGAGKGVE